CGLDLRPRLVQPVFGEDRAQRVDLAGVAPIERGQGEQQGIVVGGHGTQRWETGRQFYRSRHRGHGGSTPGSLCWTFPRTRDQWPGHRPRDQRRTPESAFAESWVADFPEISMAA